jgi:hypothetical protein
VGSRTVIALAPSATMTLVTSTLRLNMMAKKVGGRLAGAGSCSRSFSRSSSV